MIKLIKAEIDIRFSRRKYSKTLLIVFLAVFHYNNSIIIIMHSGEMICNIMCAYIIMSI